MINTLPSVWEELYDSTFGKGTKKKARAAGGGLRLRPCCLPWDGA